MAGDGNIGEIMTSAPPHTLLCTVINRSCVKREAELCNVGIGRRLTTVRHAVKPATRFYSRPSDQQCRVEPFREETAS